MLTDDHMEKEDSIAWPAQGMPPRADVVGAAMQNGAISLRLQERRRTIVALISASVISLVLWALVIALKVQ
jgi:hypothetical protein